MTQASRRTQRRDRYHASCILQRPSTSPPAPPLPSCEHAAAHAPNEPPLNTAQHNVPHMAHSRTTCPFQNLPRHISPRGNHNTYRAHDHHSSPIKVISNLPNLLQTGTGQRTTARSTQQGHILFNAQKSHPTITGLSQRRGDRGRALSVDLNNRFVAGFSAGATGLKFVSRPLDG